MGRSVVIWQAMNSLWWRVAMSFLAGSFLCPPAKAQSLFESLFGFGAAKPKAERVVPKAGARMGMTPLPYSAWKAERVESAPVDEDGYRRDPAYGGSYKTVCVRTCDGYYWPISRSVTSDRFDADAKRCDAACAGEAKLYTQHKNSDDPKSMVSLDGVPYTALKTAFLYRKTLISGCGCKPAPWSVAESYRHHQYKVADDAKKLQLAMARERERAEALRKDKIAQIIAATRDAVQLDEAEEAVFGEAVAVASADPTADVGGAAVSVDAETVAVAEVDTDPSVSVTGYIHLHVLPDAVAEAKSTEAGVGVDSGHVPSVAVLDAANAGVLVERSAKADSKVRKARTKTAKAKAGKSVQTVSLFGQTSNLTWPGDAPRRAR